MRKGKRTEVVSPQLEPYAEDIAARIPRKRNKVTPEVAARVVELRREGLSREGPSGLEGPPEIERRRPKVEQLSRISRLSGRLGLKVLRGAVSWLMLMD